MVSASELMSCFYNQHIAHIFHHTDNLLVTPRVIANVAYRRVRDIMTAAAVTDILPHISYSRSQSLGLSFGAAQQMKSQSQSRFPAHSGQFSQLADSPFKFS